MQLLCNNQNYHEIGLFPFISNFLLTPTSVPLIVL